MNLTTSYLEPNGLVLRTLSALRGAATPQFGLRLLVSAALFIFFLPFLALLFYAIPAIDDFCKAALSYDAVRQSGVLSVTWMHYMKWTPRPLTVFLQSLSMSKVSLVYGYGWLLLGVMVVDVAALCYFFRQIFGLTTGRSLLAALIFYAAYVASITQPAEMLYWLTGATEYNLSLAALLVLVSLLYRPTGTFRYYLGVALLSLAIPAMHEIAGTLLCAILLVAVAVSRFKRSRAPHLYLSLGLTGLSQTAMMLAPGIAVRAAREHRQLWDVSHAAKWFAHAFYHGLNWLAYPAVLVGALCIALLVQEQRNGGDSVQPPRWFGPACLLCMFLVMCEAALVEIATSTWLPPYVFPWFQFVFWLLMVCVLIGCVPEVSRVSISPGTKIGVFVLFSLLLLGSSNFRAAVEDLRGPARSWWRMNAARLQEHGSSLEFRQPGISPKLLMHQHLTADAGCWTNRCMATYLGAKTVVVKDSTESCP